MPSISSITDNVVSHEWMQGILRYQCSGYRRPDPGYPIIWERDQMRCYALSEVQHLDHRPVILLVPSLINRYYILDLTSQLSIAQYFEQQGMRVCILDWGTPTAQQAAYDTDHYVMQYLLPLLEHLCERYSQRISIAGYCIGGLLGLAATLLKPHCVNTLTLLATPWDFTQHHAIQALNHPVNRNAIEIACSQQPLLPGAYLSWLFYMSDPEKFEAKYRYFSTVPTHTDTFKRFIAVEHWVNDVVPLTQAFARTCLIHWAQENQTFHQKWYIEGKAICPQELTRPVCIVAPENDRIVPKASALSLANLLPRPYVILPNTGHIGMIIGRQREASLWHPLAKWLMEH